MSPYYRDSVSPQEEIKHVPASEESGANAGSTGFVRMSTRGYKSRQPVSVEGSSTEETFSRSKRTAD